MADFFDLQEILWRDLPKNLSAEDYLLIIGILKDAYKNSFVSLNQNQAQYNNHIEQLKASNKAIQEELEAKKEIIARLSLKLKGNLTLKERILGKIDLVKLTRTPDKDGQS